MLIDLRSWNILYKWHFAKELMSSSSKSGMGGDICNQLMMILILLINHFSHE